MTLFEGIILGLVQGLAEFLPISSSGHLAILQYFFNIDGEKILSFAVLLHLGTLLSLFAVYYRDIWDLLLELGAVIRDVFSGKGLRINANETRKLGFMIIVATIPTAIIGIILNDFFSSLYNSLSAIAICLLITGTILWIAERLPQAGKDMGRMKYRDAILVGIFQSIAISPGISRSGATIVGGLFSGLNRDLAVKFAFLISIPSILGAVILEAPDAFAEGIDSALFVPVATGVLVAALSGFVAIKTMIRVVTGKKLYIFSFYTWAVGALVLAYTLFL
ncbi:MAG: undecaprenyl-diphosphate phosphatase [Eubacteriales bacterium]|nr:undecaprenyl-diphosphate phosphatase [Eubacteriales bacterium]MDD4582572.1 undecaprenyl-diphosphate phosphatase [Eubacteriales bacterium]